MQHTKHDAVPCCCFFPSLLSFMLNVELVERRSSRSLSGCLLPGWRAADRRHIIFGTPRLACTNTSHQTKNVNHKIRVQTSSMRKEQKKGIVQEFSNYKNDNRRNTQNKPWSHTPKVNSPGHLFDNTNSSTPNSRWNACQSSLTYAVNRKWRSRMPFGRP